MKYFTTARIWSTATKIVMKFTKLLSHIVSHRPSRYFIISFCSIAFFVYRSHIDVTLSGHTGDHAHHAAHALRDVGTPRLDAFHCSITILF